MYLLIKPLSIKPINLVFIVYANMSFCRTLSQDHKFKSQLILYYERQLVSLSLSLKFCRSDCMLRRLCEESLDFEVGQTYFSPSPDTLSS